MPRGGEPRKGTRGNLQERICHWSGRGRVHLYSVVSYMVTLLSVFSLGLETAKESTFSGISLWDEQVWNEGGVRGKLCHKSHGFRARSSMGGGGLSLHPPPRHCLLRLNIFPPSNSKGLISKILCHISPVHCHVKLQTGWAGAQREYTKQGRP